MEEHVNQAANLSTDGLAFTDASIILRALVLGLLILVTVVGNLFVIAAILLEKNLQSVANYLIVSLAVADLMVACLVMPLGAVYEINSGWSLGPELCDMWTSSDVLCCTASILHLVAIAVDRYWAVTDLNYIQARNPRRIGMLIVTVWVVSLGISLAPQLGWKDPHYLERIADGTCLVSQDPAYQAEGGVDGVHHNEIHAGPFVNLAGEVVVVQRRERHPVDHRDTVGGIDDHDDHDHHRDESFVQPLDHVVEQEDTRNDRVETREESGENAGDNHRGVRCLLVAFLLGRVAPCHVRGLRATGVDGKRLPVAGLLQQHPEPCDIHGIFTRVQASLQEDALRWFQDNSLTVDINSIRKERDKKEMK